VGNVGDNSVGSYRLHASETQQLSYVADAAPICHLCRVARGSRQPMTGRLATHPISTTVETQMADRISTVYLVVMVAAGDCSTMAVGGVVADELEQCHEAGEAQTHYQNHERAADVSDTKRMRLQQINQLINNNNAG